jgi:shikimate dehydrogenase
MSSSRSSSEFWSEYRPRDGTVTAPSRLVLLGHPVAHSLSPVMHNAALAAAGIGVRYELLDVPPHALQETLASLARDRAEGNITVPHKTAATSLMTTLSPVARRIGAVNTFCVFDEGTLSGHNTDVAGFAGMIRKVLGRDPQDAHFAVMGAGGAAAAVLAAVEGWSGCSASVHSRNRSRAEALVARFPDVARAETLTDLQAVHADIVVNATPIGLEGDEVPVPLSSVDGDAVVVDLVYRSGETAWVRLARAEGRVASDGLPMLLEQGAAAFEIWFGMQPDRDAMWTALKLATGRV